MKKWIIWIHATAFCGLILFIQSIFLLLVVVVVVFTKAERITKKRAREFRSIEEKVEEEDEKIANRG